MGIELGTDEMVALVKRLDAEDPGYFVEWTGSGRLSARSGNP